MVNAESQINVILSAKLVAVLRHGRSEPLLPAMEALLAGGIRIHEITLTTPGALDLIRQATAKFANEAVLGAGSVFTVDDAQAAVDCGAAFIVSPIVNRPVIEWCRANGVIVMPGAYTPTEIHTAWSAGADIVKVFPADSLGPAYFKAVRGPMPHVKLMPTGGVDLTTARAFLDAGAVCLGIGSQLVDAKNLDAGNYPVFVERARSYCEIVSRFTQSKAGS
jgi:2-dehydro-3-deoxyphosphogluconate aldolase / (4S)-4-hydroxy-2-oxoglutarate aldolase